MIRIELVRYGKHLVGRTVSDRWNLEAIGVGPIRADRNQADVKRLRRITAGEFVVVVIRGGMVAADATAAERAEMGDRNADDLSVETFCGHYNDRVDA